MFSKIHLLVEFALKNSKKETPKIKTHLHEIKRKQTKRHSLKGFVISL